MKSKFCFLAFLMTAIFISLANAQILIFEENFDDFSGWYAAPDNGNGCEWTAENGWAKIKSMGINPNGHIFAKYVHDLPRQIPADEDFIFKVYILCQDGDPSEWCSGCYVELMDSDYERVAMLMWEDSQAARGYGGIIFRNWNGDVYSNDPYGSSTHNPTFDGELEIRREGTTWKAYLNGVLLASKDDPFVDRTATKVVIIINQYKYYHYRDGHIDYIQVFAENSPPVANAGEDQIAEGTSSSGTSITLDGTASFDPDNDPIIYQWEAPGITFDNPNSPTPTATFPLGITEVTLVVNDGALDSDPDAVKINVVDTTPPELKISVSPDKLWPPNHKMVDIQADVFVSDICDPAPSVYLASIVSNEPDNGLGDGDKPNDIQGRDFGIFDTEFQLRAERSGTGSGRIYTVTYSANDASGNSVNVSDSVFVPHNLGKSLSFDDGIDIPGKFVLFPNYPNPFNPETEITYQIPKSCFVTLIIYNQMGQTIRTLINESQEPGKYIIRWNGKDNFGRQVSSGIYIYVLKAGEFQETKKALLLQ